MSEHEHARPIPQGSPPSPSDDEVYVVDTRRSAPRTKATRASAPPTSPRQPSRPRPSPGPTRPADHTAYDDLGRPVHSGPPPRPPRAAVRPTGPNAPEPPHRPRRGRRVLTFLLVAALAWVGYTVFTPWHAWSTVTRENTTAGGERPAAADGHTYLLVGSDSREGLTAAERKALGVGGDASGRRTDSIILVHAPSGSGKPVLISIPRDSYLPIPGHDRNKVNAAFSIGGPTLLVETIEKATGLPIDGYLEIGFAGFAGVVDSLGGVEVCVKADIKDAKAHIDLKKGCQVLDGKNSLGYVRARYSDPTGDLGRAARQRQFLGAVMKEAATPSTVLNPFTWWGFTHSAASNVIVGEDTSLLDSWRIVSTMRKVSSEDALSLVVPLSSTNTTTRAGSSVIWDEKRAGALFGMLHDGTAIDAPPPGTDGEPTGR
ncbi:MAG: LCP family protein [Ornithinibacter sp.]